MAEHDVTVRLRYVVDSASAVQELGKIEKAQQRVAGYQGSVGVPGGTGGHVPGVGIQGSNRIGQDRIQQQSAYNSLNRQRQRALESEGFDDIRTLKVQKEYSEALRLVEERLNRTAAGTSRYNRLLREQADLQAKVSKGGGLELSMHNVRAARLGYALAAVGTYHLAVGGLNTATEISNYSQRSDLTTAQRSQAQINAIPILGTLHKAGQDLAHAIDGITERVRAATARMSQKSQTITAQGQYASGVMSEDIAIGSAEEQYNALRGLQPVVIGGNRRTFAGELQYQYEASMAPFRQRSMIAAARAGGARAAVRRSRGMLGQLDARQENILGRLRVAKQSLGNVLNQEDEQGTTQLNQQFPFATAAGVATTVLQAANVRPAERAQAVERVMSVNRELVEILNQRRQLVQTIRQQEVEAGRASVQVTRELINEKRQELNLINARLGMMSQGARRLGLMNPFERNLAESALNRAEAVGVENLPWWELQRLNSIAPNYVGNALERSFQNNPLFQRLEGLNEFGRTGFGGRTIDEAREFGQQIANQLQNLELTVDQTESLAELRAIKSTMQKMLAVLEVMLGARLTSASVQPLIQQSQAGAQP